ncbi:MAG: asparagine synthase (glutamine-hydrolyzing) [Nanoarchaeota archaeon]
MCGIIGFNFEDKKFLRDSLNEIKHRGPDDSGIYSDKNVSLGHNRLSIIDLSKSGKQPMSDKDEKIWITFNGEIYNYIELKALLEKKYNFKSNTDTEVLIYLYKEYGTEMLSKLQGMFAFCIYDAAKQILFLARDRVGIKPLYYFYNKKKFIFSSEIKGILKYPEITKIVNQDAISSFLTFRANTTENTFFQGIKKLMPGHYLIYKLDVKTIEIKKYWDLPENLETIKKSTAIKEFRQLLDDAVKSRLMSDVPYGAFLSGGIDSGTIVALMSKYSHPIKTFSVGFEEQEYTELNEAKYLAEKIGTNHHELIINGDSIKHLPKIIYHLDEPMSDPTSIPTYLLSKFAKKYCTVILTGEGADELFAGYPQYKFMLIKKLFLKSTPANFKKLIPQFLKKIPYSILDKNFKFASALGEKGIERFSNYVNSPNNAESYFNQISIFNEEEQSELLSHKINLYENYEKNFNQDIVYSCQKIDFKEPMVDDLLMKVDKNTMAFGVEGRVPFLDYRLAEFAFKLPQNLKLDLLQNKILLRESFKNLIPKETSERKKRHFFVPIENWLNNELSGIRQDLLSPNFINQQKIFNFNYIEKINKNFKASKLYYSRQLWSLISFQLWYKQYIENERIHL